MWCSKITQERYLWSAHYSADGCCSVMKPPPGPGWYCWWLRLKWEWHWGWELWWGKCVNGGNFWSAGWVRSSLHRGRCHCFRHSPACAMCVGIARHGTAACVATREKNR